MNSSSNAGKMKYYLFFTVFCAGMTGLAIEFGASRLLGNTFGTSNLVWASIIGLILIYLTVGYFIGGYWADRSPKYQTMYGILAWAGFTAGLVPFIAKPVLRMAAGAFDQLQVGILFRLIHRCIDPSYHSSYFIRHNFTICHPSCDG